MGGGGGEEGHRLPPGLASRLRVGAAGRRDTVCPPTWPPSVRADRVTAVSWGSALAMGLGIVTGTEWRVRGFSSTSPANIWEMTAHCLLIQAFFSLPGPPYLFWSRQFLHCLQSCVLSLFLHPVHAPHLALFLLFMSRQFLHCLQSCVCSCTCTFTCTYTCSC